MHIRSFPSSGYLRQGDLRVKQRTPYFFLRDLLLLEKEREGRVWLLFIIFLDTFRTLKPGVIPSWHRRIWL